jgi:cytochrome subunit of sulfide dehydrogenase
MIKAFFLFASLLASVQVVADEAKPNPISHTHIKVLAASCAACHGTNGNSVGITPTLAGLDQGYFLSQMLAFKQGERNPTVMQHHAKGLSVEEIHLLAAYFASQPRVTQTVPKSERLKDNHGQ